MKILIYGTGVIGSLTIHELCKTENDITVIARGKRKDLLEKNGLRIRIGKKEWTDHPRVLTEYDGENYDVTFSIMQNQQQEELLETLAGIHTERLVLVGNNMTSSGMQDKLQNLGFPSDNLFFAFQTTGGNRYEDYAEAVTFGQPVLTLGQLHKEPDEEEKLFFKKLFENSQMKLEFMDDMDSWYKCHMAFILPIAYLAYSHHCNLRECSLKDMKNYMKAGTEVYELYQSMGIKIRPKGDEKNTKGIRLLIYTISMWMVGKSSMGELAITNHCRNAVSEMQYMEECLNKLRAEKPEIKMPTYDMLRTAKPDWEQLREIYGSSQPKAFIGEFTSE